MLISLWVTLASAKPPPPPVAPPPFEVVAADLIGQSLVDDGAWDVLVHLSTRFGPRSAGSPALDEAITWGQAQFQAAGLTSIRQEPAMIRAWSRGELELASVAPFARPLHGLSLGSSVGTAPEGVEADVIVVGSWDELAALPDDAVRGRIVAWDVPFTTYGQTVGYRFVGAAEASKRGAVASLVRSVSPTSLSTPHTGTQWYGEGVTPIPAIAITLEDAAWLHSLQDQGVTPRVRVRSTATPLPDVPSANVIGEVRGREKPDEIVVIGCHIDAWDVGQGAQDDAAGCAQALGAVARIAAQPVPPRRTVRLVWYTGEESGVGGGKAYAKAHASEVHFAALEADTGAGAPFGFTVEARDPDAEDSDPARVDAVVARLGHVQDVLAGLGASRLKPGHAGTDISYVVGGGTVGFGLEHDTTGYWPIHHTWADTLDKIDRTSFDKGVAALAVMGWALADAPGDAPLAP